MSQHLFIDGAAGTTGLEIRQRLEGRDEFLVIDLDDDLRKDENARRDALNSADIAILCLPDDAARHAASMIDPNGATRIIDASSAHRVAEGWTYGFPELMGRERIAESKRVSNPGCYPTGFLGMLAPLVRSGVLRNDWPYSCHAVSGYSGGGKLLIERFDIDDDLVWRGYGYDLAHKHVPEMQRHAGLAYPPIFSPSVVSAFRGMSVEIPLNLAAMGLRIRASDIYAELEKFYAQSQVVMVNHASGNSIIGNELLLRAQEKPHDDMQIFVASNPKGDQLRLVALLDNLGKGASGAAVQTLNLMAGLQETAGLRLS